MTLLLLSTLCLVLPTTAQLYQRHPLPSPVGRRYLSEDLDHGPGSAVQENFNILRRAEVLGPAHLLPSRRAGPSQSPAGTPVLFPGNGSLNMTSLRELVSRRMAAVNAGRRAVPVSPDMFDVLSKTPHFTRRMSQPEKSLGAHISPHSRANLVPSGNQSGSRGDPPHNTAAPGAPRALGAGLSARRAVPPFAQVEDVAMPRMQSDPSVADGEGSAAALEIPHSLATTMERRGRSLLDIASRSVEALKGVDSSIQQREKKTALFRMAGAGGQDPVWDELLRPRQLPGEQRTSPVPDELFHKMLPNIPKPSMPTLKNTVQQLAKPSIPGIPGIPGVPSLPSMRLQPSQGLSQPKPGRRSSSSAQETPPPADARNDTANSEEELDEEEAKALADRLRGRLANKTLTDVKDEALKAKNTTTGQFRAIRKSSVGDLQRLLCLMDCKTARQSQAMSDWTFMENTWGGMTQVEQDFVSQLGGPPMGGMMHPQPAVFQVFADWCEKSCSRGQVAGNPVMQLLTTSGPGGGVVMFSGGGGGGGAFSTRSAGPPAPPAPPRPKWRLLPDHLETEAERMGRNQPQAADSSEEDGDEEDWSAEQDLDTEGAQRRGLGDDDLKSDIAAAVALLEKATAILRDRGGSRGRRALGGLEWEPGTLDSVQGLTTLGGAEHQLPEWLKRDGLPSEKEPDYDEVISNMGG